MHSKTLWNKRRFCGQLQNHVWVANFRGMNRRASVLWEFSNFFMVLWFGRSYEEMCGTILWVGKQDASTTLQNVHSMHRRPPLQRRRNEICWRIVANMLSNLSSKCLYLVRIFKTWYSMVSEQTCTIDFKVVQSLWQTIMSFWSLTFILHVNTNSIAMWETLPNNADWDCFKTPILQEIFEDSKSTSGGTLCIFLGSHTYVPISWMCKELTLVSHSSTESEIISLDAGLRLDGIPALDLQDLTVVVFGITIQTPERLVRPVVNGDKDQGSNKRGLFLSVYVDDIKMANKAEKTRSRFGKFWWKTLIWKNQPHSSTTYIRVVLKEKVQQAMRFVTKYRDMFRSQDFCWSQKKNNLQELHGNLMQKQHLLGPTTWNSCKKCLEISQLYNVATPCMDDHQFKEEENESR